jgi:hypothetical protein
VLVHRLSLPSTVRIKLLKHMADIQCVASLCAAVRKLTCHGVGRHALAEGASEKLQVGALVGVFQSVRPDIAAAAAS